jgi:hypothetical protein
MSDGSLFSIAMTNTWGAAPVGCAVGPPGAASRGAASGAEPLLEPLLDPPQPAVSANAKSANASARIPPPLSARSRRANPMTPSPIVNLTAERERGSTYARQLSH